MSKIDSFLQFRSLIRLMAGASAGLGVFVVMAVAQSGGQQEAYAQSPISWTNGGQSANGNKFGGGSDGRAKKAGSSASSAAGATAGSSTTGAAATSGSGTATGSGTSGSSAGGAAATSGSTVTPTSPAPAPLPAGTYPWHSGIKTTMFWAGEAASADNDFIQNVSSAWQTNWAGYFGGEDTPNSRCGYNPCSFTPGENPFYFALPFGDFTETGPVADLSMVYWYNSGSRAQLNAGQSILKNRWIQITAAPGGVSKTVYAQWQDVGPFNSHDGGYVFGSAAPQSTRAGLDVSPAVSTYLGMGGFTTSSWRFVEAADVPAGPWKTTVTTSGTDWN